MTDGSGISCMDISGQLMSSPAIYLGLCTAEREMEEGPVAWIGPGQGVCSAVTHTGYWWRMLSPSYLCPRKQKSAGCNLVP